MSLLTVSDLAAGYGQIGILRDVALTVDKGEILGVLGHNGMGKSTLLKALSGAIPVTRGAIVFEGLDVAREPPFRRARRGLGYVPQGRQIFPALTVRENMEYAARAAAQPLEIVDDMIARFPRLTPILDRAGGVLSGGEQQILALARCLCGRPSLVLLDEPTEGIQPSIRDEIVETLLRLRRSLGLSILLVEQNVKFMGDLADRVLHMEKGRLSAAATPEIAAMA
ncbi:ABC-type branched-subunit amino acid transport system ATPase component [Methylopila capsulata]|uniref:ABC transporter ATP-binding protein n=1 Tax=Methylopila capsulata TaxID=61654 RepID=A0A9W6IUZ2_9HYPH|nr:ABC transporter ATP-binding protein [Methylopila capsulata]MBM7850372.1 ABC-type branched-subunit amino acid transport system ATPase component [Methylopila capsulata]GLK55665.1 ABC transporter ATP-binding protein [Methylopila capsulata]